MTHTVNGDMANQDDSAWFPDRKDSGFIQKFCCKVIKSGVIPKHVAFIMDGNRRYALKMKFSRIVGHSMGFDKLTETLEWCLDLGIKEVTVYAFSIENFKRSKDEVEDLMRLAKGKFDRLLLERDKIDKHGICIRIFGDIALLPRDVQVAVANAVKISRHNNRAFLNVCLAYTARNEMTAAMKELAVGVENQMLRPSDICEDLLERCMYSGEATQPDLIIRTSGEVRLSDFLLWQSCYSCLAFLDIYWPEFTLWNFLWCIVRFQLSYDKIQDGKQYNDQMKKRLQHTSDKENALKEARLAGEVINNNVDDIVEQYIREREKRVNNFINYLDNKRLEFVNSLSTID